MLRRPVCLRPSRSGRHLASRRCGKKAMDHLGQIAAGHRRRRRDLQERALSVDKAAEELTNRLGRPPTVRQIGQALELEDEAVL